MKGKEATQVIDVFIKYFEMLCYESFYRSGMFLSLTYLNKCVLRCVGGGGEIFHLHLT